MNSTPATNDGFGDLAGLLVKFDTSTDTVEVRDGYIELMARVASPDYRRRCGLIKH